MQTNARLIWWNRISPAASLIAAVMLVYGWTLDGYFVADDFGYVSRFIALPISAWPTLFVNDWSGGIWDGTFNELRPIAALTFMVDARLWGANAGGYHLTNLVLHVLCSGLVMLVTLSITSQRAAAMAAGLLFALHPVQREAVIWITGRVDLLSALGFLLGFYGFLRYRADGRPAWLGFAWCGFGFGSFAKESCLVLPMVALLYDLVFPRGRAAPKWPTLAPYAGWVGVAAVYVGCRAIALDTLAPGSYELADVLVGAGRVVRRLTGYVGAMFVPPDMLSGVLTWLRPYAGWAGVTTLGLLAGLVVIGVALPSLRQAPVIRVAIFFGIVWPLANTSPLIVTYFSLRHLYTASAGFVIGLVVMMTWMLPKRSAFAACTAVLVVSMVAGTLPGLHAWQASQHHSRRISEAVGHVGQQAAPGDVLLLDVAELHAERWLWAWANPFALRPPFQTRDLTSRLVVVPAPGVHRDPAAWPSPRTAAGLKTLRGAGWVIWSDQDNAVQIRRFSANSVRRAFEREPLDEPESFHRLVRQLESPAP